jgi:hypothetical protein
MSKKEFSYKETEDEEAAKARFLERQATAKALRENYGKDRQRIILQNELSQNEELETLKELDADPALREEKRLDIMNSWNHKKDLQLDMLRKQFESHGIPLLEPPVDQAV